MGKYYIVKFSGNYIDDMDVESVVICNEDRMKEYQEGIDYLEEYVEMYGEASFILGTNEELIFKPGCHKYFHITELNISDDAYNALKDAGITHIDPQGVLDGLIDRYWDDSVEYDEDGTKKALIRHIIEENKLDKENIGRDGTDEWFIADSVRNLADLETTWEEYIKDASDELKNEFLLTTGYGKIDALINKIIEENNLDYDRCVVGGTPEEWIMSHIRYADPRRLPKSVSKYVESLRRDVWDKYVKDKSEDLQERFKDAMMFDPDDKD